MSKEINFLEYKKKKNESSRKTDSLDINKLIKWLKKTLIKNKTIFSNSGNLSDEEINFLFFLSTLVFNYCEENYIQVMNDFTPNDIIIQSSNLKIDNLYLRIDTIYEEDGVIVSYAYLDTIPSLFVDMDWVLNNEEHPSATKFKENMILNELETIAINFDVSLNDLYNVLKNKCK